MSQHSFPAFSQTSADGPAHHFGTQRSTSYDSSQCSWPATLGTAPAIPATGDGSVSSHDVPPASSDSPATPASVPWTPSPPPAAIPRDANSQRSAVGRASAQQLMKPRWIFQDDLLLVRLLVHQVDEGNRPLGCFRAKAWSAVMREFNIQSTLTISFINGLSKQQLRNRLDNLKRTWRAGEQMCQQSSGVFDPQTGHYVGDLEWLESLLKKYKGARYFKKNPYTHELRQGLTRIFTVDNESILPPREVAIGVKDLIDTVEAKPPPQKKRRQNGNVDIAKSIARLAQVLLATGEGERQWVSKATDIFYKKYSRKIPLLAHANILGRLRKEQFLAQQFCMAPSTPMRAALIQSDLGEASDDDKEQEDGVREDDEGVNTAIV